MEHSKLGASHASRWMACPGSVKLSEQAPPQETSIYAEQGTAAAWVLEMCIKAWKKGEELLAYYKAEDYVGKTAPNGYEITEEDAEAVQVCLDAISDIIMHGKYIVHEEARFHLDRIHPALFGTSDLVLISTDMKRLKVIDYKHGSGVPVEVVGNKQLKYYALGAIQHVCDTEKIDYLDTLGWGRTFTEVEVLIVQPRCRHKDGPVRSWIVPPNDLDKFASELKHAADATDKEGAPFKTGPHCRFCPAISICKAMNADTFALAKADFAGVSDPVNLKVPKPEMLTKAEISKILRFADNITAFLAAVESHAKTLLEHGEQLEGWKLVQKKSNRQWKDEEEARDTLALLTSVDSLYEKKFVSPAKAEKLLGKQGKKMVEDLTYKPDTGTTLAPEHDPREAVKGSAVADFLT